MTPQKWSNLTWVVCKVMLITAAWGPQSNMATTVLYVPECKCEAAAQWQAWLWQGTCYGVLCMESHRFTCLSVVVVNTSGLRYSFQRLPCWIYSWLEFWPCWNKIKDPVGPAVCSGCFYTSIQLVGTFSHISGTAERAVQGSAVRLKCEDISQADLVIEYCRL